jgi:hypothetical protein
VEQCRPVTPEGVGRCHTAAVCRLSRHAAVSPLPGRHRATTALDALPVARETLRPLPGVRVKAGPSPPELHGLCLAARSDDGGWGKREWSHSRARERRTICDETPPEHHHRRGRPPSQNATPGAPPPPQRCQLVPAQPYAMYRRIPWLPHPPAAGAADEERGTRRSFDGEVDRPAIHKSPLSLL